MSRNPYEVLGLMPGAGEADVIRQAARLTQQAGDDSIREAARQLTGSPEAREVFAWLTPSGEASLGADVERFIASHRRPPTELRLNVVPLDEAELREWIRQAVLATLEPRPLPLATVPAGESVEEIERQTSEAIWQSLLYDMGG